MNRQERIKTILTEQLSPIHLEVIDDSHKHVGHAGATPGGETHYSVIVECAAFAGVGKVKRHQMIYALLGEEFNTGLHALAIDARAPGER